MNYPCQLSQCLNYSDYSMSPTLATELFLSYVTLRVTKYVKYTGDNLKNYNGYILGTRKVFENCSNQTL